MFGLKVAKIDGGGISIKREEMINLNGIPVEIPVEPTVTILNPDGSELITTNNVTTFTFIRYEIKKNDLSGYKVRDKDGNVFVIGPDGRIFDECLYWPHYVPGAVYDELLYKLL